MIGVYVYGLCLLVIAWFKFAFATLWFVMMVLFNGFAFKLDGWYFMLSFALLLNCVWVGLLVACYV